MKCPECGSPTQVARVRDTDEGRHKLRRRICQGPAAHQVETLERPTGMAIERVLVRRSGDQELTERPFDKARLLRDVRHGVLKRMGDEELRNVVDETVFDLELRLPSILSSLTHAERRARPGFTMALGDTEIRQAVEAQLRRHGRRLPHVLYALSTLGRRDREGRLGFEHAGDVLTWMGQAENYPDLEPGPIPVPRDVPTDRWWSPDPPPLPRQVIKRDLLNRRQFGLPQFVGSIQGAMVGRPNAEDVSRNVGQWVLWGLAGQRDVLSAQLAVGVLDCLRRVDDIAYLRWTAIAKNMESVRDFRDEAVALLSNPSPRLTFRR